jgi:hypothetical protein
MKPTLDAVSKVELADALMDMVNQHFHTHNDGLLDDVALSSNELAIEVLLKAGLAKEITSIRPSGTKRRRYLLLWRNLEREEDYV